MGSVEVGAVDDDRELVTEVRAAGQGTREPAQPCPQLLAVLPGQALGRVSWVVAVDGRVAERAASEAWAAEVEFDRVEDRAKRPGGIVLVGGDVAVDRL